MQPQSIDENKHLQTLLDEQKQYYDILTDRIQAINTDLGQALDSEQRLILQGRQKRLYAEREEVVVRIAEMEEQLARLEEEKRVDQPSPVSQIVSTPVAVASIENKAKPQGPAQRPKELPQAHDDYRRTIPMWVYAGLAVLVIIVCAVSAYATGLIPPRQSPVSTPSSEGRDKETAGGAAGSPTQTPALAATPTRAATDASSSAVGSATEAIQPTETIASDAVILTGDRMTVTRPIEMQLVRVPTGEFLMGSDPSKDSSAETNEQPQHSVTLAEFYIGKYEVTNDQYAAFVKATGRAVPFTWRDNERIPDGKEDHPVTTVSWYDAVAFTRWLGEETAMPFRLCTEAEWEKACRGTIGLVYPWAGAFDERKANTSVGRIETTTPAGSYSPAGDSPYGVSDMAGNVWEWVTDWYAEDYYEASPVDNPQGPETGEYRVLRSGSYSDNEEYARCASRLSRYDANSGFYYVGFRLCASPGLASPGQ